MSGTWLIGAAVKLSANCEKVTKFIEVEAWIRFWYKIFLWQDPLTWIQRCSLYLPKDFRKSALICFFQCILEYNLYQILWSQPPWKMQGSFMETNVRRSPEVFETNPWVGGLQWLSFLCLLRWRASQEVKSQWLHLFEWDRISRSPGVGVWKKFLGAPDNQQVVSEQSEQTRAEQSAEAPPKWDVRCCQDLHSRFHFRFLMLAQSRIISDK